MTPFSIALHLITEVGLAVGAGYDLTSAGVTAQLLLVLTLLNWVETRLGEISGVRIVKYE